MEQVKLGFIGFGEAASGITKGLRKSGLEQIYFYDAFYDQEPMGSLILKRAEQTGAILCTSEEELAEKCEIIISSVIARVAVSVAESIVPFLTQKHIYVDSNTASPMIKMQIADTIRPSGAKFVDAALMGPIPAFLNKVPINASGIGAEEFRNVMSPYDMNITPLGDEPGQAAAIKMFRSIFMKGYVALLLETVIAAEKFSASEEVLKSIAETMEKDSFHESTRLLLPRGVIHAERRAFEMEEVIRTLDSLEVESSMSRATREKLLWCSGLHLKEYFGGEAPNNIQEVLEAFKSLGL